MKIKINYKKFQDDLSKIREINNKLARLGLSYDMNHPLVCIIYNWQLDEYINNQVNQLDYFDQLHCQEKIALALALTQEERNDYLQDCEIKFINNFFEIEIDHNLINKIGSRFI